MTMTDAELADIRARVEEAHGTEWIWDGEGGNTDVVDVEFGTHVCTATDIDTAFFISYCKRDIPALLDELAAAREVIAWYADKDNYDDSDCPNYGIPGEGKQINHPLDPDEWDWVPDNGTRARAFLASTEGEQP